MLKILHLILCIVFTGCLSTKHHFNTGQVLPSGKSSVICGFSKTSGYSCDGVKKKDKDEFVHCVKDEIERSGDGLKRKGYYILSRSFRLGVRDNWGLFTGVEIGYQMEIPNTLEFDVKFGLPQPDNFNFYHSISAGWGLGMWPDNTYFLEYGISRPGERWTFYANFRESYLATQIADLDIDKPEYEDDGKDHTGELFIHRQRWYHQVAAGLEYELPAIYLLPDIIHFQGIVNSPVISLPGEPKFSSSRVGHFDWQLNFGFGWNK